MTTKTEMTLKEGIKKLFSMIMTEKKLFFGGLLFMTLTTVGRLLDPIIIAHIVDYAVPNQDLKSMFLWGGAFTAVILLSGYMSYLQLIWMARLGLKIITRLKNKLFNHLLLLPIAFFDKNPAGVLIARVESDCERVRDLFSNFSVTIIGNVLFFIGMFAVLMFMNFQITLMLLLPLAIVFVFALIVIKYLAKYYKKSRELNAELTGRLTEYIQGISTIQLFNHQQQAEDYVNEKSKEKQKLDTKASFIEFGAWGINDFLISYVLIVIIILLLSPKIFDGAVSIGVLIVFLQYAVRLVWPIIQITENLNQFQRAFVSLKRVFGLMDEEIETTVHKSQITNHKSIVVPELASVPEELQVISFKLQEAPPSPPHSQASWGGQIESTPTQAQRQALALQMEGESGIFTNSIEFQNVWFQYKEDEWVLKDVSFTIKKGSKIALVGASGSGKTTTISLLCRFYTIQKGKILIDGVDLYEIPLADWRQKIGLILQDIILFPGNLLENIRIYNDDISTEKVMQAIEISHADLLLQRLDNDIESEIKERGQNLSMGERQLVSFARAICFSPEIIIMDEATASIDAKTENLIQGSMDEMLKGKTAVIIAHRLASVLDSEEILLFDNGEIVARGDHLELLRQSEEYKKLVELQFLKHELSIIN